MKKIGYCANPARNRDKDFAEIMGEIVSALSKCNSDEILWKTVCLPLKLYVLYVQELLEQGKAFQLQKAIKLILEDFFAEKSTAIIKEITNAGGLSSYFPLGSERSLLDYICNLPEKVFRNYLFFSSKQNIESYLDSIKELIDMLEKSNGNKSWLDRLESLVQNKQEKAA